MSWSKGMGAKLSLGTGVLPEDLLPHFLKDPYAREEQKQKAQGDGSRFL